MRRPYKTSSRFPKKSGQTLIFMALVVVMIAFAALMYFDVNKVLHIKSITKNGGDAAALAGARWQAISLNMIGSLNLAQAAALTDALSQGLPSTPETALIEDLQRRIAFSGPIYGVIAAQQAGKKNGLHNQEDFEDLVTSHVSLVRDEYDLIYPQPFQPANGFGNAWQEVADMYSLIADHGMAVQPAWQYYRTYSNFNRLYLNPAFYDAIAGANWCWFYHNAYSELQSYSDWTDWDPLPPMDIAPPENAEVLSLHLQFDPVTDVVNVLPPGTEWDDLLTDLQSIMESLEDSNPALLAEVNVEWPTYRPHRWTDWQSFIPDGFPWDRDIRSQYDYGGADSAMAVMAETQRHSDIQFWQDEDEAPTHSVQWSAAAKPFGSLETLGGDSPPTILDMVLPAYTDIRLIPVDSSMSGSNDQLRPGWIDFIYNILPDYLDFGLVALPPPFQNYYADQLRTWEIDDFRELGLEWLVYNSASCFQPPPGSGGSSGGTRYGR